MSDQCPSIQEVIRRTREVRAAFLAVHNDTLRPWDECLATGGELINELVKMNDAMTKVVEATLEKLGRNSSSSRRGRVDGWLS